MAHKAGDKFAQPISSHLSGEVHCFDRKLFVEHIPTITGERSPNSTLPELRRSLSDPNFRAEFLASVTNTEVVYFWQHEAGLANKAAVGSILTQLDAPFCVPFHAVRGGLWSGAN